MTTLVPKVFPYCQGMPVFSVSDVVELEQRMAEQGTPLLELMTQAGEAIASVVSGSLPKKKKNICVLAGSGNNGGDGWIAADKLAHESYNVVLLTKDVPEELTQEPLASAVRSIIERPYSFALIDCPEDDVVATCLNNADCIIDALLGTGFTYDEVRPPFSTWIEAANEAKRTSGAIIVSADVPSGLHAQLGVPAQACIEANLTITMLAVKAGLVKPRAEQYVGALFIAPLKDFNAQAIN